MPDGTAGMLFQVIDTGPGLGGRDYRVLFDPMMDTGSSIPQPVQTYDCIRRVLQAVPITMHSGCIPQRVCLSLCSGAGAMERISVVWYRNLFVVV